MIRPSWMNRRSLTAVILRPKLVRGAMQCDTLGEGRILPPAVVSLVMSEEEALSAAVRATPDKVTANPADPRFS